MNKNLEALKLRNEDMQLHTQGNRLVDASGKNILLTGVNCASMEWMSISDKLQETVEVALDDWNANIIRLPLAQDRWFGFGNDQKNVDETGSRYRHFVDEIIGVIAQRRKYVILDLHRSNNGSWGEGISGGQADMNSLVFWKALSERYGNHPNILFGLYNEPFNITWDIWRNGGEITVEYEQDDVGNQIMFDKSGRPGMRKVTYRVPGTQEMVRTVRASGANNICIVAGLDWGYELDGIVQGYDVDDCGGNGIILDSHLYPWKELDRWDELVTVAADRYPILIGECGHYGEDVVVHEGPQREISSIWVPRFLNWVDEHNYHITAWDFHDWAGPSLIKSLETYEPTPFWGSYFKDFLKKRNG